ncbi:ead/Ea22-like family protein [Chromobacterium violaceum]|uniref:ead/Ea22-like family protein n=1 Tax=Chromobacterium violaceum TaxID=536 RepID=UPI001B342DFA|nr:ead/Ea22-like family protein [Chromobacterium violaceum]MBP4048984.1 ead/Ea22-like family protein [Chromobacterium violaceum]
MLTPDQLTQLRAAAAAATPGPWTQRGIALIEAKTGELSYASIAEVFHAAEDADYIAAANPAAIQELLADLDAKTARIDELERDAARYRRMTGAEAIELARQITGPRYLWGRPCAGASWALIHLYPDNARGIQYGMHSWEFAGPICPPEVT